MTTENSMEKEEIQAITAQIAKLSEFNSTSIRDMALHFQILLSAKESRIFIEAPGLYFPDLPLVVISKSGLKRGHATIYNSILPLIPVDKRRCYGFVLYPDSFFRTCFDRVLRNTAKVIAKDLRISLENVFNRKYYKDSLLDSKVEQEIVAFMRQGL